MDLGKREKSTKSWGKKLSKPKLGCVCVFWRGSRSSWKGHVAFYVGEEGDQILVRDSGEYAFNAVGIPDHHRRPGQGGQKNGDEMAEDAMFKTDAGPHSQGVSP